MVLDAIRKHAVPSSKQHSFMVSASVPDSSFLSRLPVLTFLHVRL